MVLAIRTGFPSLGVGSVGDAQILSGHYSAAVDGSVMETSASCFLYSRFIKPPQRLFL